MRLRDILGFIWWALKAGALLLFFLATWWVWAMLLAGEKRERRYWRR